MARDADSVDNRQHPRGRGCDTKPPRNQARQPGQQHRKKWQRDERMRYCPMVANDRERIVMRDLGVGLIKNVNVGENGAERRRKYSHARLRALKNTLCRAARL